MFPILTKKMNEAEKLRVNQNFIRFVNQHIQKLAKELELELIETVKKQINNSINAEGREGKDCTITSPSP